MKNLSHNHEPDDDDDGAVKETSDKWTINSSLSQSWSGQPIALPQRRHDRNRSKPIAIVRNKDYHRSTGLSDDDDDDEEEEMNDGYDSAVDIGLDPLNITTSENKERSGVLSLSLPSHLLRAPRLTGISDNSLANPFVMQDPTMLPPAMVSADNNLRSAELSGITFEAEGRTSYGSLRDSIYRGIFLDGPSSYRDKNTGAIRALEHRVRFRDGHNVAQSLPTALSIGERIFQSRLKRKENHSQEEEGEAQPTSSLSALMDASTDDPEPSHVQHQKKETTYQPKDRTVTFYDEEYSKSLPNDMLSTSLTGLEVLQAGFGRKISYVSCSSLKSDTLGSVQPDHGQKLAFDDLDELPRNSLGNNAILPRSFSDPTPEYISSPAHRSRSSPYHAYIPGSDGTISPLHLATLQHHCPGIPCSPPISDLLGSSPLQLESAHESNPDMECGFDLDME